MTDKSQPLPLVFSFRELVIGNGFIASVQMSGRALMDEDDETWITAIAPVGFSGGGAERTEAFAAFRRTWFEILVDIASDSEDFPTFKRECESFLMGTQDDLTEDWNQALAFVRENGVTDERLRTASADEHRVSFSVDEIRPEQFAPDKNALDTGMRPAA